MTEPTALPTEHRIIRRVVTADGQVVVTLETAPVPEPHEGQVLVRVEAAPLNPSDIAVLLAGATVAQGRRDGDTLVVPLAKGARGLLPSQVGQATVVGKNSRGPLTHAH